MKKPFRINDSIRDIKVERDVFEDALRRLLEQSPTPRTLISQKVERQRRQARIRAKLEAENLR